jgi:hypothetical protein
MDMAPRESRLRRGVRTLAAAPMDIAPYRPHLRSTLRRVGRGHRLRSRHLNRTSPHVVARSRSYDRDHSMSIVPSPHRFTGSSEATIEISPYPSHLCLTLSRARPNPRWTSRYVHDPRRRGCPSADGAPIEITPYPSHLRGTGSEARPKLRLTRHVHHPIACGCPSAGEAPIEITPCPAHPHRSRSQGRPRPRSRSPNSIGPSPYPFTGSSEAGGEIINVHRALAALSGRSPQS